MNGRIQTLFSNNLSRETQINIYGHYGVAILIFPVFTDNADEVEKEGLLEAVEPFIDKGKCRVYTIEGMNFESWFNDDIPPEQRSEKHFRYNNFIVEEVVPFIFGDCGGAIPILTCGASLGGFHAANSYFRRPDIFYGFISMSATFNIEHLAKGYFDDNCYFNSPIHYLPNLTDHYWLSALQSKHHSYILSGSGEGENPYNSSDLGNVLSAKGIPHLVDIWGNEWGHNFKTWTNMLLYILETKL